MFACLSSPPTHPNASAGLACRPSPVHDWQGQFSHRPGRRHSNHSSKGSLATDPADTPTGIQAGSVDPLKTGVSPLRVPPTNTSHGAPVANNAARKTKNKKEGRGTLSETITAIAHSTGSHAARISAHTLACTTRVPTNTAVHWLHTRALILHHVPMHWLHKHAVTHHSTA